MKNSAANKIKQVPVGYLVIGIDPHKKKHAAVIMTQDFTTHSKFVNRQRKWHNLGDKIN